MKNEPKAVLIVNSNDLTNKLKGFDLHYKNDIGRKVKKIKCHFGWHTNIEVVRQDCNPNRRYYVFCRDCKQFISLPLIEEGLKERSYIRQQL